LDSAASRPITLNNVEKNMAKKTHTANSPKRGKTNKAGKKRDPISAPRLVIKRAADIKAERVKWIWRRRISRGNVTVIFGQPGLGKGQIAANLAATVSRGRKWPCKEGLAPIGHVIMINAEDGAADTVRPRLEAAGANLTRVHIMKDVADPTRGQRLFSLVADLERLDELLESIETPRLVIIDPLSAFLTPGDGQQFNANDITQVRGLLSRVDALAKKHDIAIVFICHLTKASAGTALSRLAGSSALAAAPRAAFLVTRGEDGSKWLIFAAAKNNLGSDSTTLQYRIRRKKLPSGIAPYISWNKKTLSITADEALANGSGGARKVAAAREIDEFLRKLLADGRRGSTEVFADGKEHGFSPKQLHTAAGRLGVRKFNTGSPETKKWWWELGGAANSSVASKDKADDVADDDKADDITVGDTKW
jgi:triphosphoribosyl-dephospho-CoA synthetase